jgi:hypothetical protein
MTTPQLLSRTRQHPRKVHAQHLPSCHREQSRYVSVPLSLYFPPHQDERHCITNGVWSAWAGNVARRWGIHSSGISPMDCKSSRHVSEQLSSPTCSAHPSGRGSPRRIWACRLHCAHKMVTNGACSVMAALLLVSAWVAAPCRTAKASGASSLARISYHRGHCHIWTRLRRAPVHISPHIVQPLMWSHLPKRKLRVLPFVPRDKFQYRRLSTVYRG